MGLRLDGKVAASAIKEELKNKFASLPSKATLAIIHYPEPANASYLKGRLKIADELGVEVKVFEIDFRAILNKEGAKDFPVLDGDTIEVQEAMF